MATVTYVRCILLHVYRVIKCVIYWFCSTKMTCIFYFLGNDLYHCITAFSCTCIHLTICLIILTCIVSKKRVR